MPNVSYDRTVGAEETMTILKLAGAILLVMPIGLLRTGNQNPCRVATNNNLQVAPHADGLTSPVDEKQTGTTADGEFREK
jgi:hypothetical protein